MNFSEIEIAIDLWIKLNVAEKFIIIETTTESKYYLPQFSLKSEYLLLKYSANLLLSSRQLKVSLLPSLVQMIICICKLGS